MPNNAEINAFHIIIIPNRCKEPRKHYYEESTAVIINCSRQLGNHVAASDEAHIVDYKAELADGVHHSHATFELILWI